MEYIVISNIYLSLLKCISLQDDGFFFTYGLSTFTGFFNNQKIAYNNLLNNLDFWYKCAIWFNEIEEFVNLCDGAYLRAVFSINMMQSTFIKYENIYNFGKFVFVIKIKNK